MCFCLVSKDNFLIVSKNEGCDYKIKRDSYLKIKQSVQNINLAETSLDTISQINYDINVLAYLKKYFFEIFVSHFPVFFLYFFKKRGFIDVPNRITTEMLLKKKAR